MIPSKLNRLIIRGGSYCSKRTYSSSNPIVFIDGVRTPFLASLTDFQYMMPHQLLAQAYTGLLSRTGVTGEQAKLYIPSTSSIKTQIKKFFWCFWANWAVRAILKIPAILLKYFFQRCFCSYFHWENAKILEFFITL